MQDEECGAESIPVSDAEVVGVSTGPEVLLSTQLYCCACGFANPCLGGTNSDSSPPLVWVAVLRGVIPTVRRSVPSICFHARCSTSTLLWRRWRRWIKDTHERPFNDGVRAEVFKQKGGTGGIKVQTLIRWEWLEVLHSSQSLSLHICKRPQPHPHRILQVEGHRRQ
jgi:hypothetical protein